MAPKPSVGDDRGSVRHWHRFMKDETFRYAGRLWRSVFAPMTLNARFYTAFMIKIDEL